MDPYSLENWMLGRHRELARSAETRSRLAGWQPRERLAGAVAAQLRLLADLLDGSAESSTAVSRSW